MPADRETLPFRTKILYGAGDLGFSLTSTIIGVLSASRCDWALFPVP